MKDEKLSTGPFSKSKKRESAIKGKENKPSAISTGLFACERPRACVGIRKRLIQAAIMAALFLIAAAVSYHSGYVGGRVDRAMETEVAK